MTEAPHLLLARFGNMLWTCKQNHLLTFDTNEETPLKQRVMLYACDAL